MAKLIASLLAALAVLGGMQYLPVGADPMANEVSYFAEVNASGTVERVIVITQAQINTGRWGDPSKWVQTSEKGTIRKNMASPGDTYDSGRDAFINPKASSTMIFSEEKARWEYPTSTEAKFTSSTSTPK
jgi:hypothetical protein